MLAVSTPLGGSCKSTLKALFTSTFVDGLTVLFLIFCVRVIASSGPSVMTLGTAIPKQSGLSVHAFLAASSESVKFVLVISSATHSFMQFKYEGTLPYVTAALYFPLGHTVFFPFSDTEPAATNLHALLRFSLNFPFGHILQNVCMEVEYFPAGQGIHSVSLRYKPFSVSVQSTQAVRNLLANFDAGQSSHSVRATICVASLGLTWFAGQETHVNLSLEKTHPAGHVWHVSGFS